jgi:hypothetical protein
MAAIDENERCGELPERASASLFPGRAGEGAMVLITVQIPTDVVDGERWNALVTRDRSDWKDVVANLLGEGLREFHSPRGLRLFLDWGISDQCAMQLSVMRLDGVDLQEVFRGEESRGIEGVCELTRRLELDEDGDTLMGIRLLALAPDGITWNEREVYRWKADKLVPTMHAPRSSPDRR